MQNNEIIRSSNSQQISKEILTYVKEFPEDQQLQIMERILNLTIDQWQEFDGKIKKSEIAYNDLSKFLYTLNQIEAEKKVYTAGVKAETGSGEIRIDVKGGDTRFIVPILIAIGIIIVLIIAFI